ncbi:transcriptional coactivator/pterin dehydratase [Glonium stellatum]|uniref:4a-hydroxytetrahydrobiopterin dehydratase n=1 Tax=Glonium stellatum TaxID=574774 RepID=A0A8E2F450_9PEZI|nr:transcriptional coactivator/pterin dehydratase [Glonium stellatum]
MFVEGVKLALSEDLQRQIDRLVTTTAGRWRVSENRKALEALICFKTFKKAWEFMNLVADKASKEKHHPEWCNVYNKVFIRWTTHSSSAISGKDVQMAIFCDEQANALGALQETPFESSLGSLLRPITEA